MQRREKDFEGMLEYCKEDEALLLKVLIAGKTQGRGTNQGPGAGARFRGRTGLGAGPFDSQRSWVNILDGFMLPVRDQLS